MTTLYYEDSKSKTAPTGTYNDVHSTTTEPEQPPPAYTASAQPLPNHTSSPLPLNIQPPQSNLNLAPNLNLTFLPLPLPSHPLTIHLTGDSRSPNFTATIPVSIPNQPSLPLFDIDTDSTLVYHHTHIHDRRPTGVMHVLKRTIVDGGPGVEAPRTMVRGIASRSKSKGKNQGAGAGTGEWRYTIHGAGREGKKLLEVSTTAGLVEGVGEGPGGGGETRLVFRRSDDGELDAVRLKTRPASAEGKGKGRGGLQMVVEYQGSRIGEIVLLGSSEKPVFRIDVEVAGVDPLLFVVLALVVDDWWMGEKRRYKREFGRGWTGIGKGPGAGLAAAFAL